MVDLSKFTSNKLDNLESIPLTAHKLDDLNNSIEICFNY